ncbi:MAG: hypothetical protein Q4C53_04170 [Clostridia bacterium]|nr:hypothetical protein [Clostridia bacterium]
MGWLFGGRRGRCDDCGETATLTKTGNGRRVCADCLADYRRCSVCGKYFPEEEIMFSFDKKLEFCDVCFEVMAEDLID